MKLAKGVISDLKQFVPGVVLVMQRESVWTPAACRAWALAVSDLIDERWLLRGPAMASDHTAVAVFDVPFDVSAPRARLLLDALAAMDGYDDVTAVRLQRDHFPGLQAQPYVFELRMFPPGEPEQFSESYVRWAHAAIQQVAADLGAPDKLAVGQFSSVPVANGEFAADVVATLGRPGWAFSAMWTARSGRTVVVGEPGMGVLRALIVPESATDHGSAAYALRELALRLVEVEEPIYARIGLRETGYYGIILAGDTIDQATRLVPGPQVVERQLDIAVPDAYWWQLLDVDMIARRDANLVGTPVTTNVVELEIGEPSEWVPTQPRESIFGPSWPGGPQPILLEGRQRMRSVLHPDSHEQAR